VALAATCASAQTSTAPRSLESVLTQALQKHGLKPNPVVQRSAAQALRKGTPKVNAPKAVTKLADMRPVQGVIVRFASPDAVKLAQRNEPPPAALARQVLEASGHQLTYRRPMAMGMYVFDFAKPVEIADAQAVLERLRAVSGIESVELNERVRTRSAPNDTYFSLQRNLLAPTQYLGGIDAVGAWNITTGSSATVVAVLDTGIANHSEFSGRLLPGYDFVSDPFQGNDGDGRDANASDPGSWVTPAEAQAQGCDAGDSSWHGTHVAGILGARGGNGAGVAGIDWNTRILPVRVLGKCGGSTSDVIDGMLWAAGLPVQGAPLNPTPAKIINMSLGMYSPTGCSASFQAAIKQVNARGILIVAAAGNQADEAAHYAPAACNGVVTVGAVDQNGVRASYSNYSDQSKVTISAPGGEGKISTEAMIASTTNTGTTTPDREAFVYMQGTSMAAPHIAGIASLALAANPNLSAHELTALLLLTSHDFNTSSTCATAWPSCGAGIANAANMVKAATTLKQYQVVVEFFNPEYGHYFRTGARDEPAIVESGVMGKWNNTQNYYMAWRDGSQGAAPVCRFYSQKFNSHFYTASASECEWVKQNADWKFEEIAFYAKVPTNGACPADTTPVHRFYNNRHTQNDGNHRFTTDRDAALAELTAKGWIYEGVKMCAAG
jgi:serine protease